MLQYRRSKGIFWLLHIDMLCSANIEPRCKYLYLQDWPHICWQNSVRCSNLRFFYVCVCVCVCARAREHVFTWWDRGLIYRRAGYTFDIVTHFGCRRTDPVLQELDRHMTGDTILTLNSRLLNILLLYTLGVKLHEVWKLCYCAHAPGRRLSAVLFSSFLVSTKWSSIFTIKTPVWLHTQTLLCN